MYPTHSPYSTRTQHTVTNALANILSINLLFVYFPSQAEIATLRKQLTDANNAIVDLAVEGRVDKANTREARDEVDRLQQQLAESDRRIKTLQRQLVSQLLTRRKTRIQSLTKSYRSPLPYRSPITHPTPILYLPTMYPISNIYLTYI